MSTTSSDPEAYNQPPLRIVLADDHQVVRRGLQLVLDLEPGFTVVGQANDVASAQAMLREHAPDVLVLDLHMPGRSVIEAIPGFRAEFPRTQIVVLTMDVDVVLVRAVKSAGALGYVIKDAADAELAKAVRCAAAGQPYLNRQMAAKLAAKMMLEETAD